MKENALVLVFNSDKQLLLQLRDKDDDKYPLHWDFSAGGGIDEGENPSEAARRELKEELGVEAEAEFIAQIPYSGRMGTGEASFHPEFVYVFKNYREKF